MSMTRKELKALIMSLVVGLVILPGIAGRAGAGYYEGKTIKIIEGRRPGGTGTLRTTTSIKHLKKYLGFSAAVFQYIPGGGGTAAVNQIANSVKRDGLTLGNSSSGIFSSAILGARGVRYNLDDLEILGSGSPGGATVLSIRPALKLDSVKKLKAYEGLKFANRSVGHSMYMRDRLTAYILELKNPRWVLGYSSGEIALSLGRGEADAAFGGIAGLLRDNPQWIQEGYGFPIVLPDVKGQGADAYPDFPQGIATVEQFANTKIKKDLLALHYATTPGGSIFYVYRGIPEVALKELQSAFEKLWKDKEFRKEYELITQQKADPMTGKDYSRLVRNRPRDPKVIKLYKALGSAAPLSAVQ